MIKEIVAMIVTIAVMDVMGKEDKGLYGVFLGEGVA